MARHLTIRAPLALFALLSGSCGSSSTGGNPASAAMFVGGWTGQPGAAEVDDCDQKSDTIPLSGTFTITLPTPGSGVVQSLSPNGCVLKWTANGNVATLDGIQTCTVAGALGGSWQATFNSGTLTLAGSSLALQDKGDGVLTINGVNGNCSFTQSGTFDSN